MRVPCFTPPCHAQEGQEARGGVTPRGDTSRLDEVCTESALSLQARELQTAPLPCPLRPALPGTPPPPPTPAAAAAGWLRERAWARLAGTLTSSPIWLLSR